MKLTIQELHPKEKDVFNKALENYLSDISRYYDAETIRFNQDFLKDNFKLNKSRKNSEFEYNILGAKHQGDLKGFLIRVKYYDDHEKSWIMHLGTIEKRKGIGSILLKNQIEFAKQNGFKKIGLSVSKTNILAIKSYKKFGFYTGEFERVRKGSMYMEKEI